jgi:hypothetical protein
MMVRRPKRASIVRFWTKRKTSAATTGKKA